MRLAGLTSWGRYVFYYLVGGEGGGGGGGGPGLQRRELSVGFWQFGERRTCCFCSPGRVTRSKTPSADFSVFELTTSAFSPSNSSHLPLVPGRRSEAVCMHSQPRIAWRFVPSKRLKFRFNLSAIFQFFSFFLICTRVTKHIELMTDT